MRSIFFLSALFFLSMTTNAQTSTDTSTNNTQIRELVKTIENGWAKKDGTLFAKPFAENADYVIINGMHIKGRAAIAAGHQGIFNTIYKETNIKTEVQSIRYIRPDIAIAHFTSHLTGVVNGEKIEGKGQISITVEKTTSGWQIVSFQNTKVEEQRAPTSN